MAGENNNNTELIEVHLGDGSVVKGANLDEAFKNLSEMKVNASKAIRETKDQYEREKAERERIEAELEQLKADAEANKPKETKVEDKSTGNGFDKEKYFKLMAEDPVKANRYLLKHDLQLQSEDEVPQAFMGMRGQVDALQSKVAAFEQEALASKFMAQHPDYPTGDAEAAQKFAAHIKVLTDQGLPLNISTMEFCYFQLVNSGSITPREITDEQQKPNPLEQPNPSLTGAGSVNIDTGELSKAENMSTSDLQKFLASKGMFK